MKSKLKISKRFTKKYVPKLELIQNKKPYNSTIAFYNLLSKLKLFDHKTKNIIDIGTGIGSNLKYFSDKEKKINFNGYNLIVKKPYFPDKPIKRPGAKRGNYTMKTEINKYTTFSGPVYLPWYFLVAKKNEKRKKI